MTVENRIYHTIAGRYQVDVSRVAEPDLARLDRLSASGTLQQRDLIALVQKYEGIDVRLVGGPRDMDVPSGERGAFDWDAAQDDVNALVAFAQAAFMETNRELRRSYLKQAMEAMASILTQAKEALDKELKSADQTFAGAHTAAWTKMAAGGVQLGFGLKGGADIRASYKMNAKADGMEGAAGPNAKLKAAREDAQQIFSREDHNLSNAANLEGRKLDHMQKGAVTRKQESKAEQAAEQKQVEDRFAASEAALDTRISDNLRAKREATALRRELLQRGDADSANQIDLHGFDLNHASLTKQRGSYATVAADKARIDAKFANKDDQLNAELDVQGTAVVSARMRVQQNKEDWARYNNDLDAQIARPQASYRRDSEAKLNMSRVWTQLGGGISPVVGGGGELAAARDNMAAAESSAYGRIDKTESDLANQEYQALMDFANSMRDSINEGRQMRKEAEQSTQQALSSSASKMA